MFRTVDAHTDIHLPFFEEFAPRRRDEHAVGLKRMLDLHVRRPQCLDGLECLSIEGDGHHQGFARMPDDGQGWSDPIGAEQLGEQRSHGTLLNHGGHVAIREVAITAIDIAKRRGLHNHRFFTTGDDLVRRKFMAAAQPLLPEVIPTAAIVPAVAPTHYPNRRYASRCPSHCANPRCASRCAIRRPIPRFPSRDASVRSRQCPTTSGPPWDRPRDPRVPTREIPAPSAA